MFLLQLRLPYDQRHQVGGPCMGGNKGELLEGSQCRGLTLLKNAAGNGTTPFGPDVDKWNSVCAFLLELVAH